MLVKCRTIDGHHEMLGINVKDWRFESRGLANIEDVDCACTKFLNILHIEKRVCDDGVDGI